MKFLGLNFAHLRGLSRVAAKAGEEAARQAASETDDECEEDEMKAEQETAEAEAASSAEDEDGKSKEGNKAKKSKAKKKPADEEGDDDEDPANEDSEVDDEENGKKASAPALRKSFGRGRKFERARGTAIFSAPSAASNVELAAKLAFGAEYANLSSAAAIAILDKAGSGKKNGLSSRMDGKSPNLGPSGAPEPDKAKAIEAGWAAAAEAFMPAKQ